MGLDAMAGDCTLVSGDTFVSLLGAIPIPGPRIHLPAMTLTHHSLLREGAFTGLIGGLVLAVWIFLFGVPAGHPLQAATTVGSLLFRRDLGAGLGGVDPGLTLAGVAFYIVFFLLIGIGLTQLAHLASRDRSLRMGVWLGLVVSFGLYLSVTLVVASGAGQPFSPWKMVVGSLLSTTAMAVYLLRVHPHLTSGQPLGAEGRAPPHPPE